MSREIVKISLQLPNLPDQFLVDRHRAADLVFYSMQTQRSLVTAVGVAGAVLRGRHRVIGQHPAVLIAQVEFLFGDTDADGVHRLIITDAFTVSASIPQAGI